MHSQMHRELGVDSLFLPKFCSKYMTSYVSQRFWIFLKPLYTSGSETSSAEYALTYMKADFQTIPVCTYGKNSYTAMNAMEQVRANSYQI